MPVGLKNLKSLQTLPEFVVAKDTGSKVGDLMNLKFLRKTLCISGLENVLNVEDARKADLNGKNLDVLVMKWGSVLNDLLDARVAIDVLDMLQPPITVKELSIKGYVGAKFPTWLGDPLFSKLVLLKMNSCEKCTSLPAIGQLPSLKDLVIIGMAGVRSVGSEFYGDGFFNPFRSLVRLCFEDMQEWQDWIPCGVEHEEFPCLHELSIIKCPKLQGKLPHHLPSLEKISIRKCEQLVVSIPNFPMLHEVEIVGCKEVISKSPVELSSLKSMVLSISDLTSLTEEFMQGSTKFPAALKNLFVYKCPELESVTKELQNDASLEHFQICHCEKLKSLLEGLHRLCHLYVIKIWDCSSLVSFPDGGLLPTSLRKLSIENCEKLEALPNCLPNLSALEMLYIKDCPKLEYLPENGLPPSLLKLYIYRCPLLEQHCKKGKGREWFKIANIPRVEIDWRSVYEVEEEQE
ncbi:putative disease resistance protein At3g14460 [Quercus lobata]|nr:putative disease resistance protein At3g14460 [Quercus lobata]